MNIIKKRIDAVVVGDRIVRRGGDILTVSEVRCDENSGASTPRFAFIVQPGGDLLGWYAGIFTINVEG